MRAPALRLPEPMTDLEIDAALVWHEAHSDYDIARAIEAETIKRVKEANAEARRVEMLRKLGARLAGLLDEDQFAECEALLLAAGVMPEEKDNVAKA